MTRFVRHAAYRICEYEYKFIFIYMRNIVYGRRLQLGNNVRALYNLMNSLNCV